MSPAAGWLLQSGYNCSRPFYEIIVDHGVFSWLPCPYSISGLGLSGVGMFTLAAGFIGLKNWSESWTLPITWLAIMTPAMGAALLPGSLLRRIAGVLTLAVVLLFVGIYYWWGRA